ncbi:MAG: aminoacyl-histidine dipeptidase [Rikenellaceae bacterium]
MSKIETLNPQIVWKHFAEICQRPHPSGHEEKVREYIVDFAKKNGIECVVDAIGNVILRKPATPGYEDRKGLIMQAHIDMVPQKNNDTKFDFLTDAIKPMIDGEWVTAHGTTLGADNGMGAAATLAIMEMKDLKHGKLEALFTIDEEAGMTGANNLKPNTLQGDILINLDSEDEGELYVGCAGGTDVIITLDYKLVPVCACKKVYKINISNLKGGHSGMEIILQRANSNKLMIRIIRDLYTKFGIDVASAEGGNMRNAIPREANCVVAIEASKAEAMLVELKAFTALIKSEYAETDENITVTATETTLPATGVLCSDSLNKFINMVHAMPNGIDRMSTVMPGLVETSSNMGIITMKDGVFSLMILARSSSNSTMNDLTARMQSIATLAGAKTVINNGYEGWKPNMKSPILQTMIERYKALYGKTPEIKAIHAGLECGIFGPTYPNWDMISFGPTIRFPHSPDEKVNIASVEKFFNLLLETVKDAPKK